ncbi:hypothetical protein POX_f07426 [Penicillium oxalicum]|uniref:hypothetical protein n=1 Tax=Penicillium oxalicum TaxID=69781 RepID=UPI0020B7B54C|nr:hypothetical protein POX_f07426 [Penicillium oxalicum]KAI2787070.1 hypothetical protein POX_f07426 [Penicillium oxalicum]
MFILHALAQKSRDVSNSEERTQNGETWFNLECRFPDYDGVKFGEAGIFLRVPKFRGSKPIATIEARRRKDVHGELIVDHGDSNALEQQLETVFKIAKHFKAVLLLDEADAFMEQRTSYPDTHNRLATVFLRKLEYYQGDLFLTSHRGIQFDDATLSRIRLIVKYKVLTKEFRRDLWSTFLSKACTMQGPALVEEHDIKNIAAIAHALAEVDVNQVNYKYLELAAAESNKEFSKEFGRQGMVDGMCL